jgi:hypothetical protein
MPSAEHNRNMFIIKFNEIERCYNEMSNYSLIHVTGALRYILFDSPPLLDVLNKEKRYPIYFRVMNDTRFDIDKEQIKSSLMFWIEINPQEYSGWLDLKKDAFLKFICAYVNGKPITILDIIQFYAYSRGGIHPESKGETKYNELKMAFDLLKINGLSQLDHSMRGIVQVVYATLSKYKEQLLS